VAHKRGWKFLDRDWTAVYCYAKGLPESKWSNYDLDVVYKDGGRGVGVELKIMNVGSDALRDDDQRIAEVMHPAATRTIAINPKASATKAMDDFVVKYREMIAKRRSGVAIATGVAESQVELRLGLLLYQEIDPESNQRQFVYFETPMAEANEEWVAKWKPVWEDRSGGKRRDSHSLAIYDAPGHKCFSITTSSGFKVQPYYSIPGAGDPNLYVFDVQGATSIEGVVNVHLTAQNARILEQYLGSLENLEAAILKTPEPPNLPDDYLREGIRTIALSEAAYAKLTGDYPLGDDNLSIEALLYEWEKTPPQIEETREKDLL
jgi:hypothetical protein